MDRDNPEKRIADLERQLAEQKRGADLPPAGPDHAQPHSGSAPDLAQRRLLARTRPNDEQIRIFHVGFCAALFALIAVIAALAYARVVVLPAWPPILFVFWAIVFVPFLYFISVFLARRRWARQIVICATSDGLTVNQWPGEVFSFSDASLGAWDEKASGGMGSSVTVGTALLLQCGSHRFVLGGEDHRVTPGTRLDTPPTRSVDATMSASDFEELLTIAEHRLGERQPQQANTAPEPASGSRKPSPSTLAWILQAFALFCVIGGLYFFPASCGAAFPNLVSKPTTATIDHCDNETTCYGRWNVSRGSVTGRIHGDFHGDHPVGSQVDVYARQGRDYADTAQATHGWGVIAMSGCFLAFATGVVLFWSARRKIKTGSWSWSGRRGAQPI
jgi:hypothetical protein